MDTTKINSDSTYYYYEATAPGLSYFAVGGEKLVSKPITPKQNITQELILNIADNMTENITETAPTGQVYKAPDEPVEIPMSYLIAGGVLVLVLLLGWFYYHGHKHVTKRLK